MEDVDEQVLEVVVARVGGGSVAQVQRTTREVLDGFGGFRDAVAARGVDDESLVVDLVLWADLASAEAAAHAMQTEVRLTSLREAFTDVLVFGHDRAPRGIEESLSSLRDAELLAVSVVRPRPVVPETDRHHPSHGEDRVSGPGGLTSLSLVLDDVVVDITGGGSRAVRESAGARRSGEEIVTAHPPTGDGSAMCVLVHPVRP